jgi:hypothetical protein
MHDAVLTFGSSYVPSPDSLHARCVSRVVFNPSRKGFRVDEYVAHGKKSEECKLPRSRLEQSSRIECATFMVSFASGGILLLEGHTARQEVSYLHATTQSTATRVSLRLGFKLGRWSHASQRSTAKH